MKNGVYYNGQGDFKMETGGVMKNRATKAANFLCVYKEDVYR